LQLEEVQELEAEELEEDLGEEERLDHHLPHFGSVQVHSRLASQSVAEEKPPEAATTRLTSSLSSPSTTRSRQPAQSTNEK
jgi:anti-sigma factor RsiW